MCKQSDITQQQIGDSDMIEKEKKKHISFRGCLDFVKKRDSPFARILAFDYKFEF